MSLMQNICLQALKEHSKKIYKCNVHDLGVAIQLYSISCLLLYMTHETNAASPLRVYVRQRLIKTMNNNIKIMNISDKTSK